VSFLDPFRGYDAWKTREPDWDEPPLPGEPGWPRCSTCGGFLRMKEDSVDLKEETCPCDGKVLAESYTYTMQDKEVLDIIGWDKLGTSYAIDYPAACGEEHNHPAHDFVCQAWSEVHRTCRRCGSDEIEYVV